MAHPVQQSKVRGKLRFCLKLVFRGLRPVGMPNNIRGLSPHELKLKVTTIVMSIKDISISEGIRNDLTSKNN